MKIMEEILDLIFLYNYIISVFYIFEYMKISTPYFVKIQFENMKFPKRSMELPADLNIRILINSS